MSTLDGGRSSEGPAATARRWPSDNKWPLQGGLLEAYDALHRPRHTAERHRLGGLPVEPFGHSFHRSRTHPSGCTPTPHHCASEPARCGRRPSLMRVPSSLPLPYAETAGLRQGRHRTQSTGTSPHPRQHRYGREECPNRILAARRSTCVWLESWQGGVPSDGDTWRPARSIPHMRTTFVSASCCVEADPEPISGR